MNYINEKVVLEFYLKELEADKINFLVGHHKERVKKKVEKLLECESIHDKMEAAKNLWKALFEAAMSYIDSDKRGYDRIFAYFDEFVNFEELIFASDSFYRDHTLHCLWVYFLQEYVCRNENFKSILKNTELVRKNLNSIENDLSHVTNDSCESMKRFCHEMKETMDKEESARCIAALCHDLGYPLKKIEKINKSIKGVLPYFSISNVNEFKFKYNEVEQMYIQGFINLLSTEVSVLMDNNESLEIRTLGNKIAKINDKGDVCGIDYDAVNKLSDDEILKVKYLFQFKARNVVHSNSYHIYSRNFEDYKHGIMSSFLLFKNLKAFENIDIQNSSFKLQIERINFGEIAMKQGILLAMTEHTNDNYHIKDIMEISSILTFIDELEEFSRISRANKNREFVEEFCHSRLFMEDEWFNIEFIFDNENLSNLDPERAFKGRCERFLKLFDIPNLCDNLKIRLKCIGKIQSNQNEYMLEIARKYANITINGEEQFIPRYLKSSEYYSREEYERR